ncbi:MULTISPECIES: hypothetical protein [Aerococcus]|uniref:hypothetical protein n=1 Tax=Aerococcus TaxID=1375 RepID=UPI000DCC0A58|nr:MULTISPECIES: hypothetical protein [Aerococcus]KAA9232508.1 hypothetical protein F6I37_07510 [Aerococcus mictus]MBU5611199.1 hypothetical protein [Aerococcus urinae]MDK6291614.1 hypothetical protein [Aerococcus urinae]MDK6374624.1 hypothetical protein [Aerococcus urinae]MDK6421553.1 hypothetical protein [Aerococcus urinae]
MTDWKGLDPKAFNRYRSWKNSSNPGICGSYCCSVLVHYHTLKDTGVDLDKDTLVAGFKEIVDDKRPYRGSFIWDIALALSMFCENMPYQVKAGLLTEINLPDLIDQGYGPFIVGLQKPLKSSYGNHWIVVYAYKYNPAGQLIYLAYDNQGRSQVEVPASQSLTYCYLTAKEEVTADVYISDAEKINQLQRKQGIDFIPSRGYQAHEAAKEAQEKRRFLGKDFNEWKDLII